MIEGRKIIGIIPARGGSKTLPRKNLKILAGKPLIAWTIEEAHKSQYLDRVILSSEDAEIIAVAKEWACEVPFIRPVELASDETPGIEPVIHAISVIEEDYDYIVLLQPTSPLRTTKDIDDCIRYCVREDAPFCVSVTLVDKHPFWMHTLSEDQRLRVLIPTGSLVDRRQDLPPVYIPNGAIYVAKTDYLLKEKRFITKETLAYIMPEERSWDIDNQLDYLFCALLMERKLPEKCS
jgi:N-acylneuraminate cytidylyltransferase